ncbi:MAG: iron chelate uptake ABC transporter family permease subunit [bacterium]
MNIVDIELIINLLNDYTFQVVSLGATLLGAISGVLGSFAVLRKQSLLGDTISHSALPGVVLAFLLIEVKNTEILLLGGLVSGLMATAIINFIQKNSKINFDSALAIILAVFFGAGLILLTISQRLPNANQSGLDKFIYGQASGMLLRDVKFIFGCGIILMLIVVIFWKEFKILCFDPEFARSIGLDINKLDILLNFVIVIGIIIGLQTVGVILMSAMLIAPAVASRQWVNKLSHMIMLSAFFGGVSGFIGTLFSSAIKGMPTGPMIVVVVSVIAFFSLLFAPNRGIIYDVYKKKQIKNMIKKRGA